MKEQPNLCGCRTLEEFRAETQRLANGRWTFSLKDMADEMAAKYVALYNLDEEMSDETRGV